MEERKRSERVQKRVARGRAWAEVLNAWSAATGGAEGELRLIKPCFSGEDFLVYIAIWESYDGGKKSASAGYI